MLVTEEMAAASCASLAGAGRETCEGLTSAEAAARLRAVGPNAVQDEERHVVRELLRRFWAPIPWLLEASVVLQLFLGERLEAAVIAGLLVVNAVLSHAQEGRARKALALLRQQLQIAARVRRDGRWITIRAEDLVPGDVLHLRQGGIVPADAAITDGTLLLDQSALTGESAAVSATPGQMGYAGSLIRGGEANARVEATGERTFFGRTAQLVRGAGAANRQEEEVIAVVRGLFVLSAAAMVVVAGTAHLRGLSLGYVLPLLLSILLASIPVALPATFTLAAALGSVELSKRGVLITRLGALHDIASMTVLCSDKTGTLTRNEATVRTLRPVTGYSELDLLQAAALASDPAGHDPVDGAIVQAAQARGWRDGEGRLEFRPFDPATRLAAASYRRPGEASPARFVKGAPARVAELTGAAEDVWRQGFESIVAQGQRALAVAQGDSTGLKLVGLIGLEDAVRDDARDVVSGLQTLGVRVVMITGDNALTARGVAVQVGIPPSVCPSELLRGDLRGESTSGYAVFAGALPEDKYRLVRAFQRGGEVVGMSGDGVNDAPALRQSEAGVAMANATDVAKAAAAMVLTEPGLGGVVAAIATSRLVFQRVITYTLNMLTKKVEMVALLVVGFLLTGHKPLTPMLLVLVLFLNDFLTMAISTDRMEVAQQPNRWDTPRILLAAAPIAAGRLAFTLGVFLWGHLRLGLDARHLQTLTFFATVFTAQAGIYMLRERRHFWHSRPSAFVIATSLVGLEIAAVLAWRGVLMPPIPAGILAAVAAAGVAYFASLDWVKVELFRRLQVR